MKVLWLVAHDLGPTGEALAAEHAREHEVATLDLRSGPDWARVVAAIEAADRVVSW